MGAQLRFLCARGGSDFLFLIGFKDEVHEGAAVGKLLRGLQLTAFLLRFH